MYGLHHCILKSVQYLIFLILVRMKGFLKPPIKSLSRGITSCYFYALIPRLRHDPIDTFAQKKRMAITSANTIFLYFL